LLLDEHLITYLQAKLTNSSESINLSTNENTFMVESVANESDYLCCKLTKQTKHR